MLAAKHGKHLLIEKPMALTLDECDAMLAMAEAKNMTIAIGHELRMSSLWGKVKQLIDAGAIAPLHKACSARSLRYCPHLTADPHIDVRPFPRGEDGTFLPL